MDAFELIVLGIGTAILVVSMAVIGWQELHFGSDTSYVQSWWDLVSIIGTTSGVAVLVVWLWTS